MKKVNALDDNKTSALHYAARHDNQRAVELLLSWGADVNLKGKSQVFKVVLQHITSTVFAGNDRLTPLHFAARFKGNVSASSYNKFYTPTISEEPGEKDKNARPDLPVIALLAQMGASVNAKDKYGLAPLHHAAMRGNVKEVEQLLECGGIDIEVPCLHLNQRQNHFLTKPTCFFLAKSNIDFGMNES